MPVPLSDLLAPSTTAVLTMELQRGVCGDLATMRLLADAVDECGMVPATAALLAAARAHDVAIVHCTFSLLADRAGTTMNTPIMGSLVRDPSYMLHGTDAAAVVQGAGRAGTDLESNRHHGFSPFTGTDLDGQLRVLGIRSVVITGVSLNLGVPGAAVEAVGLGYNVIVARDCTVGVPREFGDAVLANTLPVIATVTTSARIIEAWG